MEYTGFIALQQSFRLGCSMSFHVFHFEISWALFEIPQKPDMKLAFSSESSYRWKQPESLLFHTTATGSEIWTPSYRFLLSQKLPVWSKGKHIRVSCLPLMKKGQEHLSWPNHGNEDSGALKLKSCAEPKGSSIVNFSHFSEAVGKIRLLTQSMRDTKLTGNNYISISVLLHYICIQKKLVKLL